MLCDRGKEGEITSKAHLVAKESEEVFKIARKVADNCTDKRMKIVSYVFPIHVLYIKDSNTLPNKCNCIVCITLYVKKVDVLNIRMLGNVVGTLH